MSSKSIVFVAAVLATALSSQTAFAQASSPSRAAVKADTRAAEKSGKLTPAGEAANPTVTQASGPTTTRSERKSATLEARKAGDRIPVRSSKQSDSVAIGPDNYDTLPIQHDGFIAVSRQPSTARL